MKRRKINVPQGRLALFFKHVFPSSKLEIESLIEPFLLAIVSGVLMRLPYPDVDWNWVA